MTPHEVFKDGNSLVIDVTGDTMTDLFERSAYAIFDQCFDLDGVAPTYSRPLVAPGDTLGELLTNWLTVLLAESAAAGIAFSMFNVDRLEEGGLQGWASGMPVDEVVRRTRPIVAIESVEGLSRVTSGFSVRIQVGTERTLRSV